MAQAVIMPRQGQSVESCIIAKWFKQKGDAVNVGDLLFSYETDKAAFDEEAKVSGTLLEIFAEVGDDIPVLQTVAIVGNPGEDISALLPGSSTGSGSGTGSGGDTGSGKGSGESGSPTAEAVAGTPAGQVSDSAHAAAGAAGGASVSAPASASGPGTGVSPRARNLADKAGVNLSGAAGTGPGGRVIERDVIALKESGALVTSAAQGMGGELPASGTGLRGRVTTGDAAAAASGAGSASGAAIPGSFMLPAADGPATETVKISNMRKVIAKAMQNSITSTCQLTLNASFDATDILAFRKRLKDSPAALGLSKVTLNDIVLYAVSRTLPAHRDLNATFSGDEMTYYRDVNLGFATDTERGLMVPTVFAANRMSLSQISATVKALAADCQKGSIAPDNLKGGSFTVTNLGAMGIESFTPVLNAPQTGILGVCSVVQRARLVIGGEIPGSETGDGEYEFYPAMGLSLTFDHRAVDGAPAARFLKDLAGNLENFSLLLAR